MQNNIVQVIMCQNNAKQFIAVHITTKHNKANQNKGGDFMKQVNKLLRKYEKEIAILIAIQKEGRPTVEDIQRKLSEWKIKLAAKEIENYVENLRRRDLVSVILEKNDRTNISVRKYGLNKVKNVPSVPHYKDIVDYEDGKDLLEYLDDTKGVNKGRTPDIKDYWIVKLGFKVKDGMSVRGFISDGNGFQGAHYKDGKGNVILKPIHFRNFVASNLRLANKPESQGDYIGFTIGKVDLKGNKIGKEETPILVHGSGSGMKIWETIPSGAVIRTEATVPKTLFSETEFEKFLRRMCTNGLVGFGGWGKGNQNNLEVVEFDVVGQWQ